MSEKQQVVAMIPARLGSKRVKKKNLRLIDGKPLIGYVIETLLESKVFDVIYLNSESLVFKEIADSYGISFYHRPEEYSSDTSTNDEFGLDFMNNVPADILIQVLPTSPFLSVEEVRKFTETMLEGEVDSLISVEDKQIACVHENNPVNFDKLRVNPPSQTMKPVQAYATVLMGWRYGKFKANMAKYGSAYHGGDGRTGYFEIRGLSTIDIDREEDIQLVEAIIRSRHQEVSNKIQYFGGSEAGEHSENHVASILLRDGIANNVLDEANQMVAHLPDIVGAYPPEASWSKRLINTDSNSMTILCQQPGEGNRRHYHPDWNEWWYIVEGEWEWEIDGETKIVRQGDVVLMPKNKIHKITAVGSKRAIRMAVSREDVDHVYPHDSEASENQ
jgi:CMP-N-acetylneuraminic acid synthetase/quercetin dioxygenase-like cupin family protein